MIEEWMFIKGYEGKYQISNMGRVRSLDWFVPNKHSIRLIKGRVLKPAIGNSGYYYVNLSMDGIKKSIDIHRVEALTFNGYNNAHLTVNHNDGDKLNNKLSNLEFMTQAENNAHKCNVLGKGFGRNMKGNMNPMYGKKHRHESKNRMMKARKCFWAKIKSN
jgi:hypothetical protein